MSSPLLPSFPVSPPFHSHFYSKSRQSKLSFTQCLPRTTFLALFSLSFVSLYVLLLSGPPSFHPVGLEQAHHNSFHHALDNLANANKRPWKSSHKGFVPSRPQISLTPEQELAALSSFILSLPSQNALPSSVDPTQPIDPQLVLDFDARADGAAAELDQLVNDVWDTNPVVIYSKPSATARELQAAIDSLNLNPSPVIIDFTDRPDAVVLESLLGRLTSSSLPILLVHGVPVDVSTIDRVKQLSQSGTLQKIISDAGAVVDGGRRRKGRR